MSSLTSTPPPPPPPPLPVQNLCAVPPPPKIPPNPDALDMQFKKNDLFEPDLKKKSQFLIDIEKGVTLKQRPINVSNNVSIHS